ncbi:MAG: PAS domain-containing protein [Candidatus Thorarchaeota archaeon]
MSQKVTKSSFQVLLVDDNLQEMLAISDALKSSEIPFKITHCEHVEDALKHIHDDKLSFDAVISDYKLSNKSGLDLFQEVMNSGIRLPFALLSDLDSGEIAVKALKSGVNEFIFKDANKKYLDHLPSNISNLIRNNNTLKEIYSIKKRLFASEYRYKLLAENATDIIWTLDIDLNFTYLSPSIFRHTGYKVEEAKKLTIEKILLPESFELLMNALNNESSVNRIREKNNSKTRSFELRFICKDGTTIWTKTNLSFIKDSVGNPTGILGIARNITDKKQIIDNKNKIKKRLQSLISSNPAVLYTRKVDEGYSTVFISKNIIEHFGFEPNDFYDDPNFWGNHIHNDDSEKFFMDLKEVFNNGHKVFEYRFKHKDGNYRWIRDELKLIKDDNGEPKEIIGYLIDITDQKEAEKKLKKYQVDLEDLVEERTYELMVANRNLQKEIIQREAAEDKEIKLIDDLKQYTEKLESSNKELEQFAYIASHDLQEPLRKIRNFTELLEEKTKDNLDEKAKKYMFYITNGVLRMQGLINDLLTYSRITTRAKPFEAVNLEIALSDVLDNIQTVINESNAKITHDKLPTIEADKSQLKQVLQNLISNGIKFQREDAPIIHISVKEQDNNWLFSVQDNGIGIEAEYADRIFVIFQRLHTKSEYPGTGIGLAVCRKIIERHGGKIWLDSQPGVGSTFHFTIPKKMKKTERSEMITES